MLSGKNSVMLAIKYQFAKSNKDYAMLDKIQRITKDSEITPDIINYKLNKDTK